MCVYVVVGNALSNSHALLPTTKYPAGSSLSVRSVTYKMAPQRGAGTGHRNIPKWYQCSTVRIYNDTKNVPLSPPPNTEGTCAGVVATPSVYRLPSASTTGYLSQTLELSVV